MSCILNKSAGFFYSFHNIIYLKNSSVVMQRFGLLYASSPRFFIGYWILQRGWVSTRPLLLTPTPRKGYLEILPSILPSL
jgi:hypothetical protein